MAPSLTRGEWGLLICPLAIEVIADRIEHGELPPEALNVSFKVLSEQLAGG